MQNEANLVSNYKLLVLNKSMITWMLSQLASRSPSIMPISSLFMYSIKYTYLLPICVPDINVSQINIQINVHF